MINNGEAENQTDRPMRAGCHGRTLRPTFWASGAGPRASMRKMISTSVILTLLSSFSSWGWIPSLWLLFWLRPKSSYPYVPGLGTGHALAKTDQERRGSIGGKDESDADIMDKCTLRHGPNSKHPSLQFYWAAFVLLHCIRCLTSTTSGHPWGQNSAGRKSSLQFIPHAKG